MERTHLGAERAGGSELGDLGALLRRWTQGCEFEAIA